MLRFVCLLISASSENGTSRKQDLSAAGQKKMQTSIRTLRGHSGAVTALHCVTKREVWDLVGDREDAGFFISGSTDCMVNIRIIEFGCLLIIIFFVVQFVPYAVRPNNFFI